ncbi:MAG TPA: hypothetical protein VF316_13355 [Polyangiaceae bacterium]
MSLPRWLKPADATAYLAPFADDFARKGKRLGMDADREVLTFGRAGSGAAVFPGTRCDFAELADERGTVFVDGDLVCDGWVENAGGVVFVRGNLVAHSLFNSGYLVVAGELRVERFLGAGERYGTLVFGDATVTSAVLSHDHHFDVWGEHALGAPYTEKVDDVDEAREALREWAKGRGRLPEDWASRSEAPKPAPVVEPPPPPPPPPAPPPAPRSADIIELDRWLGVTVRTQREQLAVLRKDWIGRIRPDERAEATRLIRRAINSKKLVDERDELLRAFE